MASCNPEGTKFGVTALSQMRKPNPRRLNHRAGDKMGESRVLKRCLYSRFVAALFTTATSQKQP
jgi:hypothetical protein